VARAVGRLVHEIERAGVAVRDLARLGEDRLEELAGVPLGGEPDADRVQLGELAVEARDLGLGLEIGEGVAHGAGDHGTRRALGHERVPCGGVGARGGGIDERHQADVAPDLGDVARIGHDQEYGRDHLGHAIGGQRPHVVLVGEEVGGRRRRARARVVEDAAMHESA